MRRIDGAILLSPTDLNAFVGCRHATVLDRRALDEPLVRTAEDPSMTLIQEKGLEHERAYLQGLTDRGLNVETIPSDIPLRDRVERTMTALRSGADVVYQGALGHGSWLGFADSLRRVEEPSGQGAFSYEVVDTKLSGHVAPRHVVQLSMYSDLLDIAQGRLPDRMAVVLGDGTEVCLRTLGFRHYVRAAAARLEAFLAEGAASDMLPGPCGHCGLCSWQERCAAEWEEADHLSLVANIRMSQVLKLRAAGVNALARLASASEADRIPGMSADTFRKLRAQAAMQASVRGTDDHRFRLLDAAPTRGLERLPRPDPGDLFFDMEGDPLFPGGLEYLFGVHWGDRATGPFRAFWGHDREGERAAFEAFVDFATIEWRS